MGGKKKVAGTQPRVKNNLKPSSSEKAAQFLVQQIGGLGLSSPLLFGPNTPVTSGLPIDSTSGAQAKLAGFVPIPQDPDALGLDPGLLNVLRRLDKRDTRTKQKALQEFCQLIRTDVPDDEVLETGAVTSILPFWPRLYSGLSANSDRKVRELVQSAMYVLAKRVGRELAPYLKQLLPIWAFATVDFHEPAASLAEQGLSNVFPNGKRTEAYRVCARQLLDLFETKLNEGLLQVASISEKKHDNAVRSTSDPSTFELEQYSQSETAFIKLAGTIRFATVLAVELVTLPSDSPHLQRLRALVAPDNLWSRVSREIVHCLSATRSTECRSLIGSSSLVHASLYKLCSVLCCNSSWATWFSETMEGNELARYLTASTLGRLGSLVTPVTSHSQSSYPANSPYILIPPPTGVANVASSYSQCWDAALACLLNFSGELVWSTVDWHSNLVPQLEVLLTKNGIVHAQQKRAFLDNF